MGATEYETTTAEAATGLRGLVEATRGLDGGTDKLLAMYDALTPDEFAAQVAADPARGLKNARYVAGRSKPLAGMALAVARALESVLRIDGAKLPPAPITPDATPEEIAARDNVEAARELTQHARWLDTVTAADVQRDPEKFLAMLRERTGQARDAVLLQAELFHLHGRLVNQGEARGAFLGGAIGAAVAMAPAAMLRDAVARAVRSPPAPRPSGGA